jgi:hypothetical protein
MSVSLAHQIGAPSSSTAAMSQETHASRRPMGPRSMSWRKPVPTVEDSHPVGDPIDHHVKRASWSLPWFAVEPQPEVYIMCLRYH